MKKDFITYNFNEVQAQLNDAREASVEMDLYLTTDNGSTSCITFFPLQRFIV